MLNFGGLYRKPVTLFSTEVGSEMTYSMAAGYDVQKLVNVFGQLQGASMFSSNLDENPLEARLGARLRQGDFVIGLGVGVAVSFSGVPACHKCVAALSSRGRPIAVTAIRMHTRPARFVPF